MRIALPVVVLLLLAAALFGVYKAFSAPLESDVTEEVTLVDYQHRGEFDYTVFLKPSHLYGPEPAEPPPPPPEVIKYPIDMIDRFNFRFDYHLVPDGMVNGVSADAEVKATVMSPGVTETRELILVPKTSQPGDFTITFPLDVSDNYTEGIINLGDNISGNQIIITTYVFASFQTETGPVFESFTQNLPLRANGPMVEVEGNLSFTSPGYAGRLNYAQQGKYDYEVFLKPGSPFGPATVKPPSGTTPPPPLANTIGPGTPIMSQLVDRVSMSFSYRLESPQLIRRLTETVTVEAVLGDPERWRKSFELVPLMNQTGDFTVTFPIDLDKYAAFYSLIREETGSGSQSLNLAIRARVNTSAETNYGEINEEFIQDLSTDLAGDTLDWSANLTKSAPGAIKTKMSVRQVNKFLGIPVAPARILLAVVAGVIFALLVYYLLRYFLYRTGRPPVPERESQRIQKKYRELLVEIKEIPEVKPGETVVQLDSMEDLIKTAESLLKPVFHKAEGKKHIYCVFDTATRYEYTLKGRW